MQRILSFLFIAAALGFGLVSCEQDLGSDASGADIRPMASSPSADAHPAFVYARSERVWSKGAWVDMYSVTVSDSDATDAGDVYDCSSSSVKAYSATWSASGASASFVEGPVSGSGTHYIKAVDISVPTSGKGAGIPQGSNKRTITSTSDKILAQAWSQSTSVNLIAFVTQSSSEYAVWKVSTSGGSATKIYSIASSSGSLGSTVTWSNDGSEIAFVEKSGTTYSIKVISSSGTVNATLESGTYMVIDKVEWSNSGANRIAFSAVPTGTTAGYAGMLGRSLYLIGTTTGSTATQLVAGSTEYDRMTSYANAYWSPNNSELVYNRFGVVYSFGSGGSVSSIAVSKTFKIFVSTAAATDIGQISFGDWKQP